MRKALALLPCLLLAGCISIGGDNGGKNAKPVSTYTLHPRDANVSAGQGAAAVVIPKPDLPPGLSTQRIALIYGQGKMDYYADAQWSAGLEDLLQTFLIQTARHDLPGMAVTAPDQGGAARYKLAVKVTDFQPVYEATPDTIPTLTVGFTVTVMGQPAGNTVTQFSVKKTAPAAANTQTEVTKGLEKLLQDAADEALQKVGAALKAKG